jgi:hypothetical protein
MYDNRRFGVLSRPEAWNEGDREGRAMEKNRGQRIKVRIKTASATYIGTFFVPELRTRLSDVLNDKDRGDFISLTNVYANESKEKTAFVCLNKSMVESVEPYEG